jgi:hypothetical protein
VPPSRPVKSETATLLLFRFLARLATGQLLQIGEHLCFALFQLLDARQVPRPGFGEPPALLPGGCRCPLRRKAGLAEPTRG